jgi:succinyl-diaminopimelate desuccinylase
MAAAGDVAAPGSLARSLNETLLEITSILSPIGEEKALCDHIQTRLERCVPAADITRFRDSLIVRAHKKPGAKRIALVGHLDVVRTQHDGVARIEGDRLYGAGAADM